MDKTCENSKTSSVKLLITLLSVSPSSSSLCIGDKVIVVLDLPFAILYLCLQAKLIMCAYKAQLLDM